MAQTEREFAVKISANTAELVTGFESLKKKITEIADVFKSTFGVVDQEIVKIQQEVNKVISGMIGNINADAQTQMNEVVKAVAERLKEINKAAKEEEKARKDADREILKSQKEAAKEAERVRKEAQKEIQRIEREAIKEAERLERQRTQDAVREAKERTKAIETEIKRLDKVGGQFKLNILEVEKERPIKDVQDLGRVLATTQKNTQEKIRRELKALDGQSIEDIRQARDNLIQIIKQANLEQEEAIRQSYQLRLELAGENAEERVKIEEEMQAELEQAAKEGQARIEATERTAGEREKEAPNEKPIGRIGRGGAIIGTLQQQAEGALGALGPLGSALGKLGPIGLAVGAGIGLLVGGFKKAADAAKEFEDGALKIKTLLNETQAEKLDGSLALLRETAKSTGEEIVNLENSLFNVVSAVPALADNINAAAAITEKASKTAIGLGASTDDVALAATNLGNAMGLSLEDTKNVDFIMDVLSNTMKQGVIPNASDLAANIAKTAPSMAFLFENTEDATKAIGSMTAVLTANGVKVDEAQSKMKALVAELGKGSTQQKLFAAGIEGINKETGKIEDIRKVFESMGKDVGKFSSIFSSGEAVQAVQIFTKNAGQSFSGMMDTFDTAGGTAQAMFETMSTSSANASQRMSANFNDIMISLGGPANNLITGVQNAAANALGVLADLFKTTDQKLNESQGNLDNFVMLSETIGTALTDTTQQLTDLQSAGITSGEGVNAAIAQIGTTASQFKDQFPLVATDIQNIVNAPGEKTIATLTLLNTKLAEAQKLAQAETFLTAFESTELGLEKVDDTLDDVHLKMLDVLSDLDGISGLDFLSLAGQFNELIGLDIDSGDLLSNLNMGLEGVEKKLNELRTEQSGLNKDDREDAERLREIQKEVKDLYSAKQQLQAGYLQTETSISKEIERQFSNAQKLAASNNEQLNITELMDQMQFALNEKFGAQGKLTEFINQKIAEKGQLTAQQIGDADTVKLIEAERLETEIQSLNAKMLQAEIFGTLTDEQRDAIQIQIASLEIEQDHLDAKYDNVAATEDNISARTDELDTVESIIAAQSEGVSIEEEKSYITEEVNALASEILDNESLSTEQKIAQLETEYENLQIQEATLRIEQEQEANKLLKIQAQIKNNELAGEEMDKALATAEGIREQIKLLSQEAAIAGEAAKQLDIKIEGARTGGRVSKVLGGGARRRSGGGGGRSQDKADREAEKAAKDAQREAEKAAKEEEKAREKAAKDAEKAAEDRAKQAEKLEKERAERLKKQWEKESEIKIKENAERIKQVNDLKDAAKRREEAEKEVANAAKAFKDSLETNLRGLISGLTTNLGTLVGEYIPDFNKALLASIKVQEDYQKQIYELTKSTEQDKLRLENARAEYANTISELDRQTTSLNLRKGDIIIQESTKTKLESLAQTEVTTETKKKGEEKTEKTLTGYEETQAYKNQIEAIDAVTDSMKNLKIYSNKALEYYNVASKEELAAKLGVAKEDITNKLKKELLADLELQKQSALSTYGKPKYENKPTGEYNYEKENETKQRGLSLEEQKTVTELSTKIATAKQDADELQRTVDKLGADKERLDKEIKILEQRTEASTEAISLSEKQRPISELVSLITTLKAIIDRRKEIADLEKQAFNATDIKTQKELQAKAEKAKADLYKDMSEKQITEIGILDDIELQKEEIANLIESGTITLTAEEQGYIAAVTEMSDAHKELKRTTDDLTEAYITFGVNIQNVKDTIDDILTTEEDVLNNYIEEVNKLIRAGKVTVTFGQLQVETFKKSLKIDELKSLVSELKAAEPEGEQTYAQIKASIETQYQADLDLINATVEDEKKREELITLLEKRKAKQIKEADTAQQVKDAEAAAKAAEDRKAAAQGLLQTLENMGGLAEDVTSSILEIEDMFRSGNVAGGVVAAGELTKKVGQALLNAPIPQLQIAGGILLGVGLITAAVAKIWSAIAGREKTSSEKAEERAKILEKQNRVIETQIALMRDLQGMNDASVDTARERLDILQQEREELIKNNKLAALYAELTGQQLTEKKYGFENDIKALEDYKGQLEDVKDLSEAEKVDLISNLRAATGFNLEYGGFVNDADIERFIDDFDAEIKRKQSHLDAINLLLDIDTDSVEEAFNIIQERIDNANFQIQIATILEDTDIYKKGYSSLIQGLKDSLTAALGDAGVLDIVGDINNMTVEELKNIDFETLFGGLEVPQTVIDSWTELVNGIDNTNKSNADYTASLNEEEEAWIGLWEARIAAGEASESEGNTEILKYLEEELDTIDEQIKSLGWSIELEMMRLDILQKINDIKSKSGEMDSEANKNLTKAIRDYQILLDQIRAAQRGGTMTPQQQIDITASKATIAEQLRLTGATEAEIANFLATLPAFKLGGMVPETGPAIVHKGELIIPANFVRDFQEQVQLMSSIIAANHPLVKGTDEITRNFTQTVLEKEANKLQNLSQSITIGDIIINLQSTGNAKETSDKLKDELQKTILNVAQRGIDQNKIDMREKQI